MPHREWNPALFLRRLSPEALRLLVRRRVLPLSLDGEGPLSEQTYRAWMALPSDAQREAEVNLWLINDLSTEHGRPYLEELANSVWRDQRARAESRTWSAHDLAARLFLAAPQQFATVHQGYALDVLDDVIEFRGTYPAVLQTSRASKARLKSEMESYLRATPFGSRCYIEDFANESKLALYLFHEGEMTPVDRLNDDDGIECYWLRPVNRLAAVFHFETSTLFVQAQQRSHAEKLRDLFAQIFMGDPSYFEESTGRARFCFDVLREPDFRFPTRAHDRIEAVSVTRVVARLWRRDVQRVTVDVAPGASLEEVRRAVAEHGVDLITDVIDGVRLLFCFQGTGRARMRTVALTNPNRSNLHNTERDLIIRGYLKVWGIDADPRPTVVSSVGDAETR